MFGWMTRRRWLIVNAVLVAILITVVGININSESPPTGEDVVITIGPEGVLAAGDLDYTLDGVADDVQFQAALDALPAAGGRLVVVSATTINFTATVTRAIGEVTIEGSGLGTYFANDGGTALFTAGGNNWVFKNFSCDYASGVGFGATTGGSMENILLNTTYYAYWTDDDVTADEWAIPSGRGATYIVAASDASDESIAQADYVCDGTADDVQIQAAIDAADGNGGGLIILTEGTFIIDADAYINMESNICLRGSGWATIVEKTLLGADHDMFEIDTESNVFIRDMKLDNGNTTQNTARMIGGDDSNNIYLHNLWLVGGSNRLGRIQIYHSNRIVITNCFFDQIRGIQVYGGDGTYDPTTIDAIGVLIEGNHFYKTNTTTLAVGNVAGKWRIANNYFEDGYTAIDIAYSPESTIVGNTITGFTTAGIYTESAGHVTIMGNTISDTAISIHCRNSGGVDTAGDVNIIGNNIYGNTGAAAIELEGTPRVVISGNTIDEANGSGIFITKRTVGITDWESDYCVISDNIVYDFGKTLTYSRGIYVSEGSGETVVADNVIDGQSNANALEGVYILTASGENKVHGNDIFGCVAGISMYNSEGGLTINNNTLLGTGDTGVGIHVYRQDGEPKSVGILINDNVISEFQFGIAINDMDDYIIANNKVYDVYQDGIQVDIDGGWGTDPRRAMILDNDIYNFGRTHNYANGIAAYGIDYVDIRGNHIDGNSNAQTRGIRFTATNAPNSTMIDNRVIDCAVNYNGIPDDLELAWGNIGYIHPGEMRTIHVEITAGVQNTVTSVQNIFGADVLIVEAYVMISTADPDDAPTYDMGTDDDGAGAPSVGNNLFDAIPDTTGYYRSTSNGLGSGASGVQTQPILWQATGNDWVNFIITDDDGDGMAGTIYITVIGK